MHLTVTPTGKQTRIRFFMRLTDWAAAVHAPALSVSTVLIILQFILLHFGPVIEMGLALFLFGAVFMLARLGFGAIARSQERKAHKLLARLDALIEETEEGDSDEVGVALGAPSRIDAALLSDEEASEPVQPTRHREREGGA
jgi:low affinity Fe/Cu permease